MTVNYFIKCPTCNTITRMRTPAGYIYKTPVRIHCGKCNTLLTGEFVSDNEKEKAYYTPNNCEEVKPRITLIMVIINEFVLLYILMDMIF